MGGMVNRRADKMWEYIFPVLARLAMRASDLEPLDGWNFVDLGSGYGDFTIRLLEAGAAHVAFVDNNTDNLRLVKDKLAFAGFDEKRYTGLAADLNSKRDHYEIFSPYNGRTPEPAVALCLSVLPYLEFPGDLLHMMSEYTVLSIVECQYDGDGPGFDWIKHDGDMDHWLSRYFSDRDIIGSTELDIRPARRTIWACW